VTPQGRLDAAGAASLRAALTRLINRGDISTIILNLQHVIGVDRAGLATLAVAQRLCRDVGVTLHTVAIDLPAIRADGAGSELSDGGDDAIANGQQGRFRQPVGSTREQAAQPNVEGLEPDIQ
jgi:anti-anti-sigma regulatory factor